LGLLDSTTDTILFVLLPILSKVGFSIIDLYELRKLGRREPSHSAGTHSHGTAYPSGAAQQAARADEQVAANA
jgi:bacteriorhodopsin